MSEATARPSGAEVQLEGVSKSYGAIRAVRDVDLGVAPGEFVWITGRSGSGKSTLLNLMGGLETPDTGSVRIDGREVWRGRGIPQYRRSLVGFVFQHHLLLGMLTARANVEVPLIGAGVARRERARRALELLDEVGLRDRAGHRPDELSGGERQRVAVARSLVNEPRLLLADEPTGALDSATAERLLNLLLTVRERHRTTMVMVGYDQLAGARADRIYRMIDGRLEGPLADAAEALAVGGADGRGGVARPGATRDSGGGATRPRPRSTASDPGPG
ncbi:MAG: ABC transporter ATP-binding protein [Acidobacteriota bacterium]|nr:ABC transporter ATP-binding protein [Acidobacteriota bacterium]